MRAPAHMTAALAVSFAAPLLMQPAPADFTITNSSKAQQATVRHDDTKKVSHNKSAETAKKRAAAKKRAVAKKKAAAKVTVKRGDSLSKIAKQHHTTWVRLFNANKQVADPNVIYPGATLKVPSKKAKLPNRYAKLTAQQVATMPVVSSAGVNAAASPAAAPAPAQSPSAAASGQAGGDNRYVWGNCTWYVKNMRPDIGGMWGNAGYNWLSEARAAGFSTGSTPRAGAVAVTAGHVAYVTSVSGGEAHISEMNYNGGIGVVHTRTVPAGSFQYIY